MKIDPYNHKRKYLNWKKRTRKGIPNISKINSDLIKKYISDMEMGLNVATNNKKGARIK